MALQADNYVIYNESTGTLLALAANCNRALVVGGWGWDDGDGQKWAATEVANVGGNTVRCKLRNQQLYDYEHRFLSPLFEDAQRDKNYRLVGGALSCEFIIQPIAAAQPKYRILYKGKAVSLVTGEKVHKIDPRDVVHDLHADGTPIALQDQEENPAQFWTFRVIPAFNPNTISPPLPNGTYKIVNSETGTVLGVEDAGKPVHGLLSKGGDKHEWTVAVQHDYYTLRRTAAPAPYLASDVARPENGTTLIGREFAENFFTVRRAVPGTNLYKIFLDSLAVNLAVVDEKPDSLDGAVVSLQAAEAQTWYFVRVV